MRRLVLAVLLTASAAGAPAARAALPSERSVPEKTRADGVRIVRSDQGRQWVVRFGEGAQRLYRRQLAGRRVQVVCGDLTPQPVGGGLYTTSTTGMAFRAPRRRGVLPVGDDDGGLDLCAVSTRRRGGEDCGRPTAEARRWCLRVVIARTAAGRARIDDYRLYVDLATVYFGALSLGERSAASLAELQGVLGDDVVALESRDAAPPRGVVGYWTDGQALVVAAVTRTGVRRFIALDDEVYATNLPDESGPVEAVGLF